MLIIGLNARKKLITCLDPTVIPGERKHPIGHNVSVVSAIPYGPCFSQFNQSLVIVIMTDIAGLSILLLFQVQCPVVRIHRQPRAQNARETRIHGPVPLVRRSGGVPAQNTVTIRPSVDPSGVDRLVPSNVCVFHSNLFAHVRKRGAGQQQI